MMLIEEHKTIAALNVELGLEKTDSTLSQIKLGSRHSKTGTPRNMGDELARRIEAKLELPLGWMDTPPTYSELNGKDDPRAKVMALMDALPADQWPTVARLLGALAEPGAKTGT